MGKGVFTRSLMILIPMISIGCSLLPEEEHKSGTFAGGGIEVESFLEYRAITVGWQGDIQADEYVLQRARDEIDGVGPYNEVYRGRKTKYVDRKVEDDIRYVYRMDVIQKGNVHEGEQTGIGVGNSAEVDLNEPNNQRKEATALRLFKRGTMYYFRFSDGRELTDIDWYKVNVGGGKSVYLQIQEDGVAGMTTLLMEIEGEEPFLAEQGKWYELHNETKTEKEWHITIYPHVEDYVAGGMTGGTIRKYTIIRSDSMTAPPDNGGDDGGGETQPGNGGDDGGGGNDGGGETQPGNGGDDGGGNDGGGETQPGNGGDDGGGNDGGGETQPGNGGDDGGGNDGGGETQPGNGGDDGGGGNDGGGETQPGNGGDDGELIQEKSELFEQDLTGRFIFFLNEQQYQGKSYTFWKYLKQEWEAKTGMSMELVKESGNYFGGYGFFFAGGNVNGYGESMLVLQIQKDGNYTVGKVVEGDYYEIIVPWKSSVYLRKGYGVKNTVGVRWDSQSEHYIITLNGVEETRFRDMKAPVCTGKKVGVVAVVTSKEQFPQTPVKVGYK